MSKFPREQLVVLVITVIALMGLGSLVLFTDTFVGQAYNYGLTECSIISEEVVPLGRYPGASTCAARILEVDPLVFISLSLSDDHDCLGVHHGVPIVRNRALRNVAYITTGDDGISTNINWRELCQGYAYDLDSVSNPIEGWRELGNLWLPESFDEAARCLDFSWQDWHGFADLPRDERPADFEALRIGQDWSPSLGMQLDNEIVDVACKEDIDAQAFDQDDDSHPDIMDNEPCGARTQLIEGACSCDQGYANTNEDWTDGCEAEAGMDQEIQVDGCQELNLPGATYIVGDFVDDSPFNHACLPITANNVRVVFNEDGSEHIIRLTGTPRPAVRVDGADTVELVGPHIRNSSISINDATNVRILDAHIRGSGSNAIHIAGASSQISIVRADLQENDRGIFIGQGSVDGVVIEDSIISNNTDMGVYTTNGARGIVFERNEISRNGDKGLELHTPATFEGNTICTNNPLGRVDMSCEFALSGEGNIVGSHLEHDFRCEITPEYRDDFYAVDENGEDIACEARAALLGGGVHELSSCRPANGWYENGTYLLTQDIEMRSLSSCLIINRKNVTLDCQGHTVLGRRTDGNFGLRGVGDDLTVRNCRFEGFDTGLVVDGNTASRATVVDNVFVGNGHAGLQSNAGESLIARNVAFENGIGFNVGGVDVVIVNNTAERNTRSGIDLSGSGDFTRNIACGNEEMDFTCSDQDLGWTGDGNFFDDAGLNKVDLCGNGGNLWPILGEGYSFCSERVDGLDSDGDGIVDEIDNCPGTANVDQLDTNDDGEGDVCESGRIDEGLDSDGDGVANEGDNCPDIANRFQEDSDGNGIGDVCDGEDEDGDGVIGSLDNCPNHANPHQENNDDDSVGDVCDSDDDNDGVLDGADNCPIEFNARQTDRDGDGLGDVCDSEYPALFEGRGLLVEIVELTDQGYRVWIRATRDYPTSALSAVVILRNDRGENVGLKQETIEGLRRGEARTIRIADPGGVARVGVYAWDALPPGIITAYVGGEHEIE